MNYIVFDLEWNQCPTGKSHEIKRLPFEIVEIGAVKLNEQKEIVDTFHALIRPVAYRRIHPKTREVISLTIEQLDRDGIPFDEAADQFREFCGKNSRFCTWGTSDLEELQRNLAWYGMLHLLPGPIIYEDVQKLFALTYETRKVRRALEWAVDYLHFQKDREFHEAVDDAWYTAKIFQTIPDDVIARNYSIDTFQNPKNRDDEIKIRYDTYEKYISREFRSKEDLMSDRGLTQIHCFLCHQKTRKVVRWFSNGGHNYLAVSKCEQHGFVKSKIRIKKTDDERYYAVRTTRMVSPEDVTKIREKQSHLRIKRQQKRKK